MRKFWIALALAACAHAQDDLAAAVRSPYTFQHYVDTHPFIDFAPLWKSLGIDEDSFPDCDTSSGKSEGDCSAEMITVFAPDQTLVRLHHLSRKFDAYLRYMPDGSGWRLEGVFVPLIRTTEPRHTLIRFGSKPYLLVTGERDYGDEVAEYESWLDLSRPGMKPVFGYTVHGNSARYDSGVTKDVHGMLLSLKTEPERILLAWNAIFSAPAKYDAGSLGIVSFTTAYVRQPDGTFGFDASHSTISRDDAEKLFERPGIRNEDFLRFDLEKLKEYAAGADGPEKRWLTKFLMACKDTPEKRELQSLLAK